MSLPIIMLTGDCGGKVPSPFAQKLTSQEHRKASAIYIGILIVDTLVSITCLVVGILGALSIIGMPPAAAYTLIGISCAVTVPYLVFLGFAIAGCCRGTKRQSTIVSDKN